MYSAVVADKFFFEMGDETQSCWDEEGLVELAAGAGSASDSEDSAPQAKAAKEKAKAKASAKRQANKGNGGAVKGVMYMSRSTCLVCSEQPVRGHRWCVEHKRAEAAMKYQAQKSNQLQQYDQVMKDDAKAAEAVRDYVKSTPAGQRWTRKPLIDWVSWGQKYGVRLAVSEKDTSEPMTEAKFWRWAVDVEGQTESAAAAWWREIYESDADRDHNGRAGALRLWVPVSQVRERTKTRYIDASVESHSCQMKNVSPEELASLKNFTLDQDMSYGDDFMKQAASSSSPAKAAKLAPLAVADAEGKDVAGAPSATPVKVEPPAKKMRVDLQQVLPKLLTKFTQDLTELHRGMTASLATATATMTNHKALVEDGTDKSFMAFHKNLEFRSKVVSAWLASGASTFASSTDQVSVSVCKMFYCLRHVACPLLSSC
jgi:hypothetical protein